MNVHEEAEMIKTMEKLEPGDSLQRPDEIKFDDLDEWCTGRDIEITQFSHTWRYITFDIQFCDLHEDYILVNVQKFLPTDMSITMEDRDMTNTYDEENITSKNKKVSRFELQDWLRTENVPFDVEENTFRIYHHECDMTYNELKINVTNLQPSGTTVKFMHEKRHSIIEIEEEDEPKSVLPDTGFDWTELPLEDRLHWAEHWEEVDSGTVSEFEHDKENIYITVELDWGETFTEEYEIPTPGDSNDKLKKIAEHCGYNLTTVSEIEGSTVPIVVNEHDNWMISNHPKPAERTEETEDLGPIDDLIQTAINLLKPLTKPYLNVFSARQWYMIFIGMIVLFLLLYFF